MRTWLFAPKPETPQRKPLSEKAEWAQWRSFIGTKRTCSECGLVMGDPEKHSAWHESVITRTVLTQLYDAKRSTYEA